MESWQFAQMGNSESVSDTWKSQTEGDAPTEEKPDKSDNGERVRELYQRMRARRDEWRRRNGWASD